MPKINLAFVIVLLGVVFCCGGTSAAEISLLSSQQMASRDFSSDGYLLRQELKVVAAFKWSYAGSTGVLLTATPYGAGDPGECVVLSAKFTPVRLIAVSKLLFKCKWEGAKPKFIKSNGFQLLRFENMVDVTGDDIEYQRNFLDLIFDEGRKDFCMFDWYAEGKRVCKRF